MSRSRYVLLAVLAAPLVCFGLLTAGWAIAGPGSDRREVTPNVELAGKPIGSTPASRLEQRITDITEHFGDTAIIVDTPKFDLETTASDLGLTVDTEATAAAALDIGRDDPGPAAPLRWAKSWFATRTAPLRVAVDGDRAAKVLRELEADQRTDPVEPTLNATADEVTATNGSDGTALDVDAIVAAIPAGFRAIGEPIRLRAEQVVTPPEVSDADVARLAQQANEITAKPLTLKFGEASGELAGADIRPGFALDTSGNAPKLTLSQDYVAKVLAEKISPNPNPTGVTFDIVDGVPTPKPGTDAVVCCGDQAPAQIVEALLAGKGEATLETRTQTAAEGLEWAKSLGVKEVVGEFTTKHPCCAPRVKNIHRISDLTRGVLIAPGATFSANDFVGKRTAERGFVSAPVIEEGKFTEDFGGGVSQWATTTFNAAFFAGLDIPTHKAHSIYISRYPFGREATLAYPSVDLKLTNNTPYGVVIWPTYTDNSITVQLWSTRYVTGEQTAINKKSGCGYVKVTRTRTYTDGRTDDDSFEASYNCNPPEH